MSLSRRVGWSAAWQISGRLYTSALAFFVVSLLLPRRLGEAEFGVFAFHLTLYQLLANVLDFGAGTIVVREASRDRGAAGRLIGMLVGLKARVGLVGMAALIAVAWIFEGPGGRFALLVVGAAHLLFHAPAGAAAIFHVDMDFRRPVAALALGQTAWLAATLVLALAHVADPAPYVLAYALFPVVNGVLIYAWARRRVTVRYDASRAERSHLWQQAWPAGVSMAMASVYFYIDTVMLRPLVDEVAVAHYSAAYRLMAFVLMVPVLFSQVVFPVFSRLWAGGAGALDPFFQRCTVVLLSIGVTFPATVPWVAADVIAVVYPPAYGAGAPVLAVLSLAIVLVFAAYPHVMTLLASGHQRTMMLVSVGGAALNVALNLALVPRLGILGAAWATVATEAFVLAASAAAVARRTGLRLRVAPLVRPAACAAAAAVALAWGRDAVTPGAARLALGVVVGLVAVAASGAFPLDLGSEEGAPKA